MSSQAFLIVVQKATGVLNADGMMGTSDPYAKVTTPTAPAILNASTHVVQNSLNPVWDVGVLVALPTTVSAIVKVDVFDSDSGTLVDGSDVSLHILLLFHEQARKLCH
jgi:Ca2+-dependent lipid-binding protein